MVCVVGATQTVFTVAMLRTSVLLRWLVSGSLFLLRSYGFWPFYYDTESRQYRTNRLLLCYPLVVLASGLYLFERVASELFEHTSFLFYTESAVLLLKLFRGVSAVAFSCNFLLQYLRFGEIERIWKCAERLLRDILDDLPTTTSNSGMRLIGVFLLKTVALPTAFALIDFYQIYRFSPVVREEPWKVFVLEGAFFIIGVVTNVYVGAMLAVGHLFGRLNEETRSIATSAAELFQPMKPGRLRGRAHRFCELSERMDRVAEMHRRLSELATRVHRLFSASVAVYVLYRMLDGLLRAFVAYVFSVQWQLVTLLSESGEFPLLVIVCDVLLAMVDCADLMVLAWICTEADVQVSRE